MPNPDDRLAHLLVVGRAQREEFTRQGRGRFKKRTVDRAEHGQNLRGQADGALAAADGLRDDVDEVQLRATGSIIVIEGADEIHLLKLESLDRAYNRWWYLLNVHRDSEGVEYAVVWVSDRARDRFLKLFDDYLTGDSPSGNPKNEALVVNVGRIRAALLRDLWQSDGEPPSDRQWWEIWLRREDDADALLQRFAIAQRLPIARARIELDQRIVRWVRGRWRDLEVLPATAVPVAEIRQGQFLDTVRDLDTEEQWELVDDLRQRIHPCDDDAPAVCLLDTGVRRTHALLKDSLAQADCHTVLGASAGDVNGHGTRMAGLALLGPLDDLLTGNGSIELAHRLESVKLLHDPAQPDHEPRTYGLVTAQATALPEVTSRRRRTYSLPITAPAERSDQPSLWSAAVDALAAGTDITIDGDDLKLLGPPNPEAARLFVVSAGNADLHRPPDDYLEVCDLSIIEDPGQAWNVLTVGAATNLDRTPSDPTYDGWTTVAPAGGLSPHSRTGVLIPPAWPLRPDICMEGGNALTNGLDIDPNHPITSLTTTARGDDLALGSANATSAATAQASRLAARAMAAYPDYWPETIRGLLVHAAEWTPLMQADVNAAQNVSQKRAVLGRYGWGIPDELALLTSARNAVTMVTQDSFVPFTGRDHTMRQFRLHQLPWPTDLLAELGPADVRFKISLSYFVEPSAPRRGWRNRYTYRSHGLRFELQEPTETTPEFIRRVNREAATEEGGGRRTSSRGINRWAIGPTVRNAGSLHQDIWEGSGAELARSGVIAVHPVGGWWKNNKRRDRQGLPIRYALIVSLSTPDQDVDIYQPIATQLDVDISSVSIEV